MLKAQAVDAGPGLAMTGDDGRSRAEHYREIAASLARLAAQMRFHEIRQQLFTLAEQFERMAEFADKWEENDR
jgi:hypothetical protein